MTNIATTTEQSKIDQATEKSSEVVDVAREQAQSVVSTAREQVEHVAGDTKQQARRLVDDTRQQLRTTAREQAGRISNTLREIGTQLEEMASSTSGGNATVTEVTRQAGSTVERWADELDRRGIEGITSDVKRFARQRPGIFLAGALGAGVLVGRLIRTVDTGAIVDAAKPDSGSSNGGQPQGQPQLPMTSVTAPSAPTAPATPATPAAPPTMTTPVVAPAETTAQMPGAF